MTFRGVDGLMISVYENDSESDSDDERKPPGKEADLETDPHLASILSRIKF